MATLKQKQELVDALKFVPRDIEITLSGYGGEIVMGRISEAAYDYWQDRDDLDDYATAWDNEGFEDVPADANFCPDGAWHDVDDLCHESGCEASDGCWITVDDALEGRTIFQSITDLDALDQHGVDTSGHSHVCPQEDEPNGTYVFLAQNFEKGTFFSGSVRITQPFDPSKLAIYWTDCDGWRLIGSVEYDGEEVDGHGAYSTTGKGMECKVYEVENDNEEMPKSVCTSERWDPVEELDKILKDMPVLEGEEMWASEAIDADAQKTPWWSGDQQPVHLGLYEVEYQDVKWPWPSEGYATWDGQTWIPDDGRDPLPVLRWRGLREPA
jgi:hypothetical protein